MLSSSRILRRPVILQQALCFLSPRLPSFSSTSNVATSSIATRSAATGGSECVRLRKGSLQAPVIPSRNFADFSEGPLKPGSRFSADKQSGGSSKKDIEFREALPDTEKSRFDMRNENKKNDDQREFQRQEHEEFIIISGGHPDPARMWKSVPKEMASTDTGGYIKLEDIGIDLEEVDAVHRKDNENDARLRPSKDPAEPKDKSSTPLGNSQLRAKKNSDESAASALFSKLDDKSRNREKEDQLTDPEDEDAKPRRMVSSAQQSVLWEGTPRSTTGGAQSSSEAGGIELLTEQLFDREAANDRSASFEADEDEKLDSDSEKPKKDTKKEKK